MPESKKQLNLARAVVSGKAKGTMPSKVAQIDAFKGHKMSELPKQAAKPKAKK